MTYPRPKLPGSPLRGPVSSIISRFGDCFTHLFQSVLGNYLSLFVFKRPNVKSENDRRVFLSGVVFLLVYNEAQPPSSPRAMSPQVL